MKQAKQEKTETTEETKAVAVPAAAQVPEISPELAAWGASPIDEKDIVIPRLLLMQPGSDLVTDGKASFGHVINSLTGEKIADMQTPFKVLPFMLKKSWVEYEAPAKKGDKKRFLRTYAVAPDNKDQKYEGEEKNDEGKTIKITRDLCMNFYVLLPSELDRGGELPYILTFRRTALKDGKKLATQMYVTNYGAQLPPPALIVTVAVKKQATDAGTWCTPDVLLSPDATKRSSKEQIEAALKWFKTINSSNMKEDNSALEREENAVPSEVVNSGPAKF
jgi:hypothetical protein